VRVYVRQNGCIYRFMQKQNKHISESWPRDDVHSTLADPDVSFAHGKGPRGKCVFSHPDDR